MDEYSLLGGLAMFKAAPMVKPDEFK